MQFDREENRRAAFWFFGAGIFAICLAIFVVKVDLYITYSDAEKVRGAEMKELRTAQASLATTKPDSRLIAGH